MNCILFQLEKKQETLPAIFMSIKAVPEPIPKRQNGKRKGRKAKAMQGTEER